jgi:hypothetical protein
VHPLANAETPPSLRNFVFSIDGRPTYFHESDDPQRSLYEVMTSSLAHDTNVVLVGEDTA